MQLDKSKKYEFCGEVYGWSARMGVWDTLNWNYGAERFQLFADHGHVKEIREPLVFEGEVAFYANGNSSSSGLVNFERMPESDRKGKTFKVTWTEVVK